MLHHGPPPTSTAPRLLLRSHSNSCCPAPFAARLQTLSRTWVVIAHTSVSHTSQPAAAEQGTPRRQLMHCGDALTVTSTKCWAYNAGPNGIFCSEGIIFSAFKSEGLHDKIVQHCMPGQRRSPCRRRPALCRQWAHAGESQGTRTWPRQAPRTLHSARRLSSFPMAPHPTAAAMCACLLLYGSSALVC